MFSLTRLGWRILPACGYLGTLGWQRYFEKAGNDYFPLPAQWDIANKVWRAYFVREGTDWWASKADWATAALNVEGVFAVAGGEPGPPPAWKLIF